jgi:hypothetical protein
VRPVSCGPEQISIYDAGHRTRTNCRPENFSRGGQLVRPGPAKPLFVGSIPARTSRKDSPLRRFRVWRLAPWVSVVSCPSLSRIKRLFTRERGSDSSQCGSSILTLCQLRDHLKSIELETNLRGVRSVHRPFPPVSRGISTENGCCTHIGLFITK